MYRIVFEKSLLKLKIDKIVHNFLMTNLFPTIAENRKDRPDNIHYSFLLEQIDKKKSD